MIPGSVLIGSSPPADPQPFKIASFSSPDSILRTPNVAKAYKLEFALGGDLTQSLNSSATKLASVVSFGTQDSGFPASNVIGGWTCHYNPLTDTDNNWWQGSYFLTQQVTIDLSAQTSFNEIQLYLHPLKPTCSAFTIQGSNDNATWFNLFSGSNQPTKLVLRFKDQQSWRYLRFIPNNGGSDGKVRVVAICVFNWVDETSNIMEATPDSGVPNVTSDFKSDLDQSGLSTFSEVDIVLNNSIGRYSPFNSSSPLYGTLQADGRGSGFRGGIKVRLTASAFTATASYTQSYFFEGFIQNDDSAAGTQGIILNDPVDGSQKTATVICKSLGTLITKNIDTPAYEGATGDYIFRDLCYRCGIADQDIYTAGLNQTVPYIAVSKQSALATMQQMIGGNPFMRVFEKYSPNAQIAGVNFGRSRSDLNLNVLSNPTFLSQGMQTLVAVPSTKKIYFHDGGFLYVWDQTLPFGQGTSVLGAFNPGGLGQAATAMWAYGATIYMAFRNVSGGNTAFYSYNTLGIFNVVSLGTVSAVLGVHRYIGYLVVDKYFYWVDGSSNLRVWDVTQGISTMLLIATPGITGGIYGDGTFFAFDASTNVKIWKHNGTPLTTTFSTVSWAQEVSWPGFGIVGDNHQLYATYVSAQNVLHTLDLNAAYNNPGGTSSVIAVASTPGSLFAVSGTYAYLLNSGTQQGGISTIGVANSATGLTMTLGTIPYTSFAYDVSTFDFSSQLWLIPTLNTYKLIGFKVQGSNTYPTNISYSFDIQDSFTQQIVVSDGNPFANRVQIYNDLMTTAAVTALFQLQNNTWNALAGQKSTFSMTFGTSLRGRDLLQQNTSDGTQRVLVLNPQTQNITGGGSTSTITVASTTGIVDGQPVVLQGGTPEIRLVQSHTPTTITFTNVNGTAHTSVVFSAYVGGCLPDNPNLITNITIGAASVPCTFWAYSSVGYFILDATLLGTGITISSASIYGVGITTPASNVIALDVTDQPSKNLYKQEFLDVVQNIFFNDLSFYQDILLNGKFAKLYLQELDTPWYPVFQLGTLMAVTDTTFGLSAAQFEVVEVKQNGWQTQVASKNVLSIFKI